ncbi:MAG: hypothetical protein JNL83_26700 [Myxococcales bacterium]|nr:hypothetical protein [Myxococcales bacterium]
MTERDALLALWARNLPVHGDVAAKHQWLYLDSPGGHSEAFLLRAPTGEAVGCAGIVNRELWSAGHPVRAGLFADISVDRAHRSGLPAIVLQREVKRHVDATFDLCYGLPNTHAIALYRKLGYHELGKMKRYVRVLRRGGYLARYVAGRQLPAGLSGAATACSRAAGALIDGPVHLLEVARASLSSVTSSLTWLPDFDTRFDRLWEATRDAVGIACRRDAAFLRWRFSRKPSEQNAIAALINRTTDRLRAYAVVRGASGEAAELGDFFGPRDALDDLLTLLPPALYRRGHTSIGVRFLGDPSIAALLEAHRFSPRDAQRSVIVSQGASGAIATATLHDPAAWYLTDLDEDT